MGLDNPLHIAFLLVILLLVFGAKRLPEIGRSLGEGMRGFKSSIEGVSAPAGISAATAARSVPAAQPAPGAPVQQAAAAAGRDRAGCSADSRRGECADARLKRRSPCARVCLCEPMRGPLSRSAAAALQRG